MNDGIGSDYLLAVCALIIVYFWGGIHRLKESALCDKEIEGIV